MEILVKEIANRVGYCISKMFLDGKYFCDVLQPQNRGLRADKPEQIRKLKIYGKTKIPAGRYRLNLGIHSPRFGALDFYKRVCGGKLPTLENVRGFSRILIHAGNSQHDTEGCLLVGRNTEVGRVTQSRKTFEALMQELNKASGDIWITIA